MVAFKNLNKLVCLSFSKHSSRLRLQASLKLLSCQISPCKWSTSPSSISSWISLEYQCWQITRPLVMSHNWIWVILRSKSLKTVSNSSNRWTRKTSRPLNRKMSWTCPSTFKDNILTNLSQLCSLSPSNRTCSNKELRRISMVCSKCKLSSHKCQLTKCSQISLFLTLNRRCIWRMHEILPAFWSSKLCWIIWLSRQSSAFKPTRSTSSRSSTYSSNCNCKCPSSSSQPFQSIPSSKCKLAAYLIKRMHLQSISETSCPSLCGISQCSLVKKFPWI